jgi:hypothetical protein
MVDKLFGSIFKAMDNNKVISTVTNVVGLGPESKVPTKVPEGSCSFHRLKKKFYCEDCLLELCQTCKELHETDHVVKFVEETVAFIKDSFKSVSR